MKRKSVPASAINAWAFSHLLSNMLMNLKPHDQRGAL
jgi:hypothetical protein